MFLSSFYSNQRKKSATWRQDRNFIVVTICFHFYHLLISIFPCIHCCTSLTDLSSNISITASDDIEQLRDSNARLNRKWIFAKITKRVSFFNIHNHSRNSISNDIQVMPWNNYNVASYKDWLQTTYIIVIYIFLRNIAQIFFMHRQFIYFQQYVLTYCFFNTSTLLPSNWYHSKI